ncbi:MAG: hypothetical protein QXH40_03750 [Candidatus Bathyarchaeia archaeon]
MKGCKALTALILILLVVAISGKVAANAEVRVYRYSFAGIEVFLENPSEIYPNQTITIDVATKALTNLTISWMWIEFYTFHNSTTEETMFYNITHILTTVTLSYSQWVNGTYEVPIPEYAVNVVYGRMVLKWAVSGTEETTTYERKLTFIMGYLKSLELEKLRNEVERLEGENALLRENLTELLNNLAEIKNRYEGELNGTRSTVTVLAITTIFFLATTAYLVLRKPREYW